MADIIATTEVNETTKTIHNEPKAALTPPTSEEWNKDAESSQDELSDLEMEEDEEEVVPDHYYGNGRIPVFKPTMDQFRDFQKYINKIDKYGMRSGIVKIIPPKEWRDSLPALDGSVKSIRVKNPITQDFAGTHGTYTQANIEKQRSYNLPQWKALTDETQHQPPARRGEKRKKQEKAPKPAPRARAAPSVEPTDGTPAKRRPGRPPKKKPAVVLKQEDEEESSILQAPPTPTSPEAESKPAVRVKQETSPKQKKPAREKTGGRQPKMMTISERRKYNRQDKVEAIDEAAFEDFDYRFDSSEFTAERCTELEEKYWKSLTFAPPMYGADMPGSLFDESTECWNVAKLPNLLDVIGQKVPGVNTAYLYLGMWKATFAWHLEDVDLYSINYIHFGAPKQWYSISQEDARRFENAMKSIWPTDAKNCSQFLRHKTYLISPALLKSQFNIEVNKLVHYEGEFVITYPYGYHSGYNLGYNCAESVNFATEAWLDYGKIAKKCDCEADSVWINVEDIERKLRGEPTPEYYEETDEGGDIEETITDLPSPPASVVTRKPKGPGRKRKRETTAQAQPERPAKKIKIRIRTSNFEPCVLCPNSMSAEPLLPTDTGRHAHRICALYTPETYLAVVNGVETIMGIANIDKARLDLKCSFCRSKKGACFQCSSRKCTRAFHATCAAPGGVQAEYGPTPVYGEDGTEYVSDGYDFRCRFHRPKRAKNLTIDALEVSALIRRFAKALQPKDTVQAQYLQGEVFAGTVVENRPEERAVLLDILPDGDRVEVDWKYLTVLDAADSQLPKPSETAKPLPAHMYGQATITRSAEFGPPMEGDIFLEGNDGLKWAEFHTSPAPRNPAQVKIDLNKENQIWFYLGKYSTEARAQFSESPDKKVYNIAGNFLDSVKPAAPYYPPVPRRPSTTSMSTDTHQQPRPAPVPLPRQPSQTLSELNVRPYQYKPRSGSTSNSGTPMQDLRRVDSQTKQSLLGNSTQSPAWNPNSVHRKASWQTASSPYGHPPVVAPISTSSQTVYTNSYDNHAQTPSMGQSINASGSNNPFMRRQQWSPPSLSTSSASWAPYRTTQSSTPKPSILAQAVSSPTAPMTSTRTDTTQPAARPPHDWLQAVPAPVVPMTSAPNDIVQPAVRPSNDWLQSSKDFEFVKRIQPYRYLVNSYCRRPKEYKSPYTADGGYSTEYEKLLPGNEPLAKLNSQEPVYQECTIPLAALKPTLGSIQQQHEPEVEAISPLLSSLQTQSAYSLSGNDAYLPTLAAPIPTPYQLPPLSSAQSQSQPQPQPYAPRPLPPSMPIAMPAPTLISMQTPLQMPLPTYGMYQTPAQFQQQMWQEQQQQQKAGTEYDRFLAQISSSARGSGRDGGSI